MIPDTLNQSKSTPFDGTSIGSWMTHQRVTISLFVSAAMLGYLIAGQRWTMLAGFLFLPLALLWPVETALGAVALLTPFDLLSAIVGAGGRSLTWYVSALAIVVVWGVGLVRRRLQRPPAAALWWLLFVAWAAASVVWAIDPKAVLDHLPTVVSLLLLYLATVSVRITRKELSVIAMLAIVGAVAAGAYACEQFYQGHFFRTTERGSLVAGESQADPNLFAASLLLPLSLAIYYLLSSKSWSKKSLALASGIVILLAILATMSRGALLAVVVMLFIFLHRWGVKSRFRRWVATLSLLVPVLIGVVTLFVLRSQETGSVRGSGRLDIWIVGLTSLKRYGLIGAGLENFFFVFRAYAGYQPSFRYYSMGAHNIYLQVWVELGIVGLLLMIAAITSQLKVVQRLCATKGAVFAREIVPYEAACWGLLVAGFFLGVIWFKMFWLAWIMLGLASRTAASSNSVAAQHEYEVMRSQPQPTRVRFPAWNGVRVNGSVNREYR